MMDVYALLAIDWEESWVLGVYSTLEAAQAAAGPAQALLNADAKTKTEQWGWEVDPYATITEGPFALNATPTSIEFKGIIK